MIFSILSTVAVWGLGVVAVISLYQAAVIAVGSWLPRFRRSQVEAPPTHRFTIIIPASDEESVVGGLVHDLLAQDYPHELRSVLVVAHNCSDATAGVARAAGADVIELSTVERIKDVAVIAGLEHLADDVSLVGVIDADAEVRPGLLRAVSGSIGDAPALQVETEPASETGGLVGGYGIARRARSLLYWRPRSRLGLSVVLTGGAYFLRPKALLAQFESFRTMTEDLELTARLVVSGGKVVYLRTPAVRVQEAPSVSVSLWQRTRWARGHLAVIRGEFFPLVGRAARGHLPALDFALYLAVPTRMLTRYVVAVGLVLALLSPGMAPPLWLMMTAAVGELILPAIVCVYGGLVRGNTRDFLALARVTVLSLLWIPIGIAALVTLRRRTWMSVPRKSRPARVARVKEGRSADGPVGTSGGP